jgi:hypothetical protein
MHVEGRKILFRAQRKGARKSDEFAVRTTNNGFVVHFFFTVHPLKSTWQTFWRMAKCRFNVVHGAVLESRRVQKCVYSVIFCRYTNHEMHRKKS